MMVFDAESDGGVLKHWLKYDSWRANEAFKLMCCIHPDCDDFDVEVGLVFPPFTAPKDADLVNRRANYQLEMMWDLWRSGIRVSQHEEEFYPPNYFIKWAIEKGFEIPWLKWANDNKLFDEIERKTHAAINADSFRALQVELEAARAELADAEKRADDITREMDALRKEHDSLLMTQAASDKATTTGYTFTLLRPSDNFQAVIDVINKNWADVIPGREPKQVNIAREIDAALGRKSQRAGEPSRNASAIAALFRPEKIEPNE